jgi:seryl-tRNA synthetase
MSDYGEMTIDELEKERAKKQALLEDIQHERAFLGKQAGMHINASEFARLDRDAEATERKIGEIEAAIAAAKG